MVRPWNASCIATTPERPVSRVSLSAASLASAPELEKNTRASTSAGVIRATSRSASSTCGGLVKKLETWPSVRTCALSASTTAGWPWPRVLTAMPPSRSTYSRPWSSHTWAPSPRTSASLGGPKAFINEAP